MMENESGKIVFFIGMPRSGTTVIFNCIATHDRVAWLSQYMNKIPYFWSLQNKLLSVYRSSQTGGIADRGELFGFRTTLKPVPSEGYSFWSKNSGSNFDSFLNHIEPEVNEASTTKKLIFDAIKLQNRDIFVHKFTGPGRIRYLSTIFPDALFVHVIRDPRAVCASLLNVNFWNDRNGDIKPLWQDGFTKESQEKLSALNYAPVALAALQWRDVVADISESSFGSSGKLITIKYENFIHEPVGEIGKLLVSMNLNSCLSVSKSVGSQQLVSQNMKFSTQFSTAELDTISECCGEVAGRFGYEI